MEELAVGTRVEHPRYGEGIISKNKITSYEIFFEHGGKIELTKRNEDLEVKEPPAEKPKNSLTLAEVEKLLIRQTLARVTSNREEAARLLGISRRTLQYKLKEYGLLAEPPAD